MTDALIIDTARTPRARVRREGGSLAHLPSADLLAVVLRALVDRGLTPEDVDDVIIGVSTAVGEQGGDVARVAAMAAGLPDRVPGGVVSRLCCSGLDAVVSGAARVRAGMAQLIVAGGVESMSRVPMLADRPAFAFDAEVGDATGFTPLGVAADATAMRAGIERPELDAWGLRSQQRSAAAPAWESIVPLLSASGTMLAHDEGARPDTTLESLAALPPLSADDPLWSRADARLCTSADEDRGRHTIGTAPGLADAAAGIVIASEAWASDHGREARGRIIGAAQAAVRSPGLDATVPACHAALAQAGIAASELALVEVNESFAVTPILLRKELGLADEIVNPCGGAIAVGHPLGASGGILIANAVDQLRRTGGGYALVTVPAALGLATAVVIEVFA